MHVEPTFVADGKAAEPVQPGKALLDHPSVPAELLSRIETAPSDAGFDVAAGTGASATTMVIGFVGMQLVWPASWSAALAGNRRHGVKQRLHRHAVVHVGAAQQEGEQGTAAICDQVPLCARPASICRARTDRGTPFWAAMDELSI
jgi:hypothetical protein